MLRQSPICTLFPYTTLFRSLADRHLLAEDPLEGGDQLADGDALAGADVDDHAGCVDGGQHDVEALERADVRPRRVPDRSEEHTSELQSRRDLVCRLLLEKKK